MSDPTDARLGETLDWIGETAREGKEFILEQAPLYAQEVVSWTFYSGVIGLVIGVVLLAIGGASLMKGFRKLKNDCSWDDYVVGMFFIMGACLVIPISSADIIKSKVAPRVIIVEHLRKEVSK